jgi:hypothetical protein
MKNDQNLQKQIIANQLNIDTSRVLDVKKTWKNWNVMTRQENQQKNLEKQKKYID